MTNRRHGMAGLSFKVGADTTGLGKGLRRAEGMVGRFGGSIKKLGLAGLAVGLGAATAGMAGLAVAARGVKGALDLGGRLSDVSANTGILAGQVMILERAFKDAGAEGKLQGTITKMQRSIVEAGEGLETYNKAFKAINLSVDDLMAMSPEEQFSAIQKGISALENPAERSARAMQIFGKSGSELGALFADKNALGDAAATVGLQADILDKNAGAFDRSSDILAGIGEKLQGFFVGMASFINPLLLPVLEQMNKIDLAAYGQAAGRFVAVVAEAFKSGALPGLVGDSLKVGLKVALNVLIRGLKGAAVFFGTAIIEGFKSAVAIISSADLWSGIGNALKSIGSFLKADFKEAASYVTIGATSARMSKESASDRAAGMGQAILSATQISSAMEASGVGDVMVKAAEAASDVYKETADAYSIKGEMGRIKTTFDKLGKIVDKKAAEKSDEEVAATGAGGIAAMKSAVVGAVKARVSSLQRVGGASLGAASVNLDQDRNALLRDIRRNTGKPATARFA